MSQNGKSLGVHHRAVAVFLCIAATAVSLLTGCVPYVVSVYVPEAGVAEEHSVCGWTNVWVPLYKQDGVEIAAGFAGSSGIGVHGLKVQLAEGVVLDFDSNSLMATSAELSNPIYLQFGAAERGSIRYVHEIEGPIVTQLQLDSVDSARPHSLTLAMPSIRVNGVRTSPLPVRLKLRQSAALVGLCQ